MQSDDEHGDIDVTSDEEESMSYRNGVGNGGSFDEDDDSYLNQDGQDEEMPSGQLAQEEQAEEKLDKRAHHNALERKRRDHIKESFSNLRDSLPNIQGEKSSRAQILKQATDYIEGANQKNKKRSSDIDMLKEENRRLLMEVQAMEKAAGLTSFTTKVGGALTAPGGSSDSEMEEITTSRAANHTTKSRPRKKLKL